ncbi:MAG: helix-turn-helix domain-containing protein [Candidatus Limiplasma sp.]|nr:helix-turn-helix domain-containing protein [Candidatus Limiplasma sp.]
MEISTQEVYRIVFKEYPEVLDVKQVSQLLGVSTKTVYKLVKNGSLAALRIGREFRFPKVLIMKYMRVIETMASTQTD